MKHEMRTITTVEELDALPVGAVIKDSYGESGWVYELTDGGDWATTGSEGYYSPVWWKPWWQTRTVHHSRWVAPIAAWCLSVWHDGRVSQVIDTRAEDETP